MTILHIAPMKKLLLSVFTVCIFTIQVFSNTTEKTIPDTVSIGAYVLSVHDISFRDNEYTMRYWLWMLYNNPNFDLTSQVEVPNAKAIEKPEILVDTIDGQTWVLMKMKSIMKQSWQVRHYPFDKQYLKIRIENTLFDKDQLIFVADTTGSKFDPDLNVDGWEITAFNVNTNEKEYTTNFGDFSLEKQNSTYAAFNINMRLERDAWGLFFKLFIGMYVAFLITLISFILSQTVIEPRFGLPVGGLFATVGNKYIIDTLLPETSTFTLVDTLHTITFLAIFVTIAINAISLRLHNQNKNSKASAVNRIGLYVVTSGYIILNIFFVVLAILS